MRHLLESRYASLLFLAVIVCGLPLILHPGYQIRVAALIWISGIAAVGLHVLMGQAGQVSLGQTGFMGIGAYSVGLLPTLLGIPSLAAAAIGIVAAGLIAYLVGKPLLRLQGHYLAVATLGFGLIVALVLTSEVQLTGGPDGLRVPRLTILSTRIVSPANWYWIGGVGLLIAVALAIHLRESPTGRALRALQDSETAARTLGIDVAARKLQAFIIAAIYAATAGSMLALMNGFITPDVASFFSSVEYVAMVVIGGIASPIGAVVGATFLTVLPQVLAGFSEYEDLLIGLLIMLFMIFLRDGIVPSLAAIVARRRS
ncbi:branched-chain amino acid transport system permease protein [Bradyrhizobium sp. LA6.1]|uniref:branched-chain amino acid ABC transporter permease n=1 Tax=Bradyrhizobium sp. LA6.1 TaxID=3156378 RepID=UPI003397D27B